MHEIGIARDLWKKILEEAAKKRLSKISSVTIKLGEAAGIEKELLRHSLKDHIFPGTIAQGASLIIDDEPIKSKCYKCGCHITKNNMTGLACPKCGGIDIEIISGNKVYVERVES